MDLLIQGSLMSWRKSVYKKGRPLWRPFCDGNYLFEEAYMERSHGHSSDRLTVLDEHNGR